MININIREEIFGATLNVLDFGKREYITKKELRDVLKKNKYPKDSIANKITDPKVKFVSLKTRCKPSKKGFSFADIVFIELTRGCNLRCKHCLNDSGKPLQNQLTKKDFIKIINDLSDAGIQEIRFTGGEPLLFSGIYDLIRQATNLGIYTSLGTNGTLITDEVVKKLKKAGLRKAVISIDGTEKMHDRIRGLGNYKKALDGAMLLKQNGIEVRINSVIMRSNIKEVIKFAREMDKKHIHLFIRRFIESGRGALLKDNMLTAEDYEKVRNALTVEINDRPYVNGHYLRNDEGITSRIKLPFEIKGCKAGQRAFTIMPDGEINLCGFLAAQGFQGISNVRDIKNWNGFWNELQEHDKLAFLRKNLNKYNAIPNIQETYCLAYIQRYCTLEGKC